MKYIEQRIEALEKEVAFLKSKQSSDYLFNSDPNLLPELETTFASPWEKSQEQKNSLDTLINPPYPDILGSWDSYVK